MWAFVFGGSGKGDEGGGGGSDPPTQPGTPLADNWTSIQLPRWIVPDYYELNLLNINFRKDVFNGLVVIHLNVTAPTRFIVVHYDEDALSVSPKDIHLRSKSAKLNNLQEQGPVRIDVRKELQYALLWFEKDGRVLDIGSYALTIRFSGNFTGRLRGFYTSHYERVDGVKKPIAVTQFEATEARKAFPCLDEPFMKAGFQINITAPPGYHALSNMPIVSKIPANEEYTTFVFDRSPAMSTYLVAYVISDFVATRGETLDGIPVTVWTPPGQAESGNYALQIAKHTLPYYASVFGIKYALPKLDMVAIPDFSAGAMENWGLVTYVDSGLLVDDKVSSEEDKQRVADLVTHELAHQWFGNLVTMEWWDDLWLNEGFAEFIQYKGTNAAEPHWRALEQFVPIDLLDAFDADGTQYSHPIAANVSNPAEIGEIFDDISYGKGSAVLRMLEAWMDGQLGEGGFLRRVGKYLETYRMGSAKTEDLWRALSDEKINVTAQMRTWTDQQGYPVLNVSVKGNELVLYQSRFFHSSLVPHEPNSQLWSIPLTYMLPEAAGVPKTLTAIVHKKSQVVRIAEGAKVLVNPGRVGVYRVAYQPEMYSWLEANLHTLSPVDRGGIIDDAISLILSGTSPTASPGLALLRPLRNETDSIVWQIVLRSLETLELSMRMHSGWDNLRAFKRGLLDNVVKSVGWEESSTDLQNDMSNTTDLHPRALLRSSILSKAVALGHTDTVKTALKYFDQIQHNKSLELDPDVMNVVYEAGVLWSDSAAYEWVYDQYTKSHGLPSQIALRLLSALCSSQVPNHQLRTLKLALSKQLRHRQDASGIFVMVAQRGGPTGAIMAWTLLRERWEDVVRVMGPRVNKVVGGVVGMMGMESWIAEAEQVFVERKGWAGDGKGVPFRAEVVVRKAVEKARQRVLFNQRYGNEVDRWITTQL
ncbi:peptidase family M1-domain-containing protein [Phlyctochytrium arcticum]|nr:peptidase family M1-domain-containing protein [Phlyctochytrium arcticum]